MKRIRSTLWLTLSIFWVFVPCLALSALLHAADQDIGSLRALASAEMLASVFAWSFPFAAGGLVSLALLSNFGLRGFSKSVFVASSALGLLVAALGSSAVTPLGVLWSVTGSALVVLVFLVVAVLPSLIVALRGTSVARG